METDRLKTEASQSRISQALDESFNLLSLGKFAHHDCKDC